MKRVGLSAGLLLAFCGCAQKSFQFRTSSSEAAKATEKATAYPVVFASSEQPIGDYFQETSEAVPSPPSLEGVPAKPGLLTLSEAEWRAVASSPIVRADADFFRFDETVPSARTQFDSDIAASGFLYGQRGAQAALSDFDTRLVRRISASRNELIQNNRFLSGGILPGGTLESRAGTYEGALQKTNVFGGQSSLIHHWDYDASNREDLLYRSVLTGTLRAEYRQPLLAGFGRDYNLTAGPLNESINGVTGVNQGVLIARNNTRIARINLQEAVAGLIRDTRRLYWATVENREKSQLFMETKHQLEALLNQLRAVSRAQLATGRLAELELEELISQVQGDILLSHQQLDESFVRFCRLIGDGFPPDYQELAEIPPCIPVAFDITSSQQIALASRSDLQKRQLQVASSRLQVKAAKNLLMPRLDLTTGYWANGFGDRLLGQGVPAPDRDTQVAFENLFQNDHTGWDVGLQYSQILGRRLAVTRVRNIELQLARDMQLLREREREVALEIEASIMQAEHALENVRLKASQVAQQQEKIGLIQAQIHAGWNPDLLLSLSRAYYAFGTAQARLLEACTQYESAKTEVIFRRGDILRNANVSIERPG